MFVLITKFAICASISKKSGPTRGVVRTSTSFLFYFERPHNCGSSSDDVMTLYVQRCFLKLTRASSKIEDGE